MATLLYAIMALSLAAVVVSLVAGVAMIGAVVFLLYQFVRRV